MYRNNVLKILFLLWFCCKRERNSTGKFLWIHLKTQRNNTDGAEKRSVYAGKKYIGHWRSHHHHNLCSGLGCSHHPLFHQQTLDRGNSSSFRNAYYHSLHLLQCLGCIQGSPSQQEVNCCLYQVSLETKEKLLQK